MKTKPDPKDNCTPTGETHNGAPVYVEHESDRPKLVKFGRGGSVVYYGRTPRYHDRKTEGYETPETFFAPSRWWAHEYATRTDPQPYEGCPWLDVRGAVETAAGLRMCFSGPMVDVDSTEPRRFTASATSEMIRSATQGNTFGALLDLALAQETAGEEYSSLDYVPTSTYLALWKAAGATVGTIRNGRFVEE